MSTNEQQFHYFATCAFGWATSDKLEGLAKKLKRYCHVKGKKKIHYWIFKVPLPQKAEYKINFFVPQVEGIEEIEKGEI